MAMKVTYTVVNGEVLSVNRNGVIRDYVPDSLGSTIALLDNTQTITDTFEYWPYGEVRLRTGTATTPFQFVGTLGYYSDAAGRTYVRARYLRTTLTRWLTEDPIGFSSGDVNTYVYVRNRTSTAIDLTGLKLKIAPGCKESGNIQKGIDKACTLLTNMPSFDPIMDKDGSIRNCIKKFCSQSNEIQCGNPTCANDRIVNPKDCSRGNNNGSPPDKCVITVCTKVVGNPRCFRPGISNPVDNIAVTLIHEMIHCCGIHDEGWPEIGARQCAGIPKYQP